MSLSAALQDARDNEYNVTIEANPLGFTASIGHEERPRLKPWEERSKHFADPDELGVWVREWVQERIRERIERGRALARTAVPKDASRVPDLVWLEKERGGR